MANQYKITNANATASNITISVAFKRDTDIDAVRTENLIYSAGTSKDIIVADLEVRSKNSITTYENDKIVVDLLKTTTDWVTVSEQVVVK